MVTISDMTNEQMNKRTGQPNMYCLCRQCQHKNNEKRLNLITAELSSGPITACERSSGENTVKSEKALWNRHVIQTGMKKRESNGCWEWWFDVTVITSSSALLVSFLLTVSSSSSRSLRISSSRSETRVFSLSRRISSDTLPSRKISFSLHQQISSPRHQLAIFHKQMIK